MTLPHKKIRNPSFRNPYISNISLSLVTIISLPSSYFPSSFSPHSIYHHLHLFSPSSLLRPLTKSSNPSTLFNLNPPSSSNLLTFSSSSPQNSQTLSTQSFLSIPQTLKHTSLNPETEEIYKVMGCVYDWWDGMRIDGMRLRMRFGIDRMELRSGIWGWRGQSQGR